MAQPFGATNEPHTCKWCGRKLRIFGPDVKPKEPVKAIYTAAQQERDRQHEIEREQRVARNGPRYGAYGDGHFCTLGCAHMFAVRMADLGKHFEPIRKESAA